jgi:hypothetical protein
MRKSEEGKGESEFGSGKAEFGMIKHRAEDME